MAKIIKLENINLTPTGEQVTEEYVCENCRHLIASTDTICWQCREKLEQSKQVEHYHKGEKLTNEGFDAVRGNFSKPN